MTHDEVFSKLGEILKNLCPDLDISNAKEDTSLAELGMDSLTMLLMALQAEKVFCIRFENAGASTFRTVGDVCDYIESKL